MSPFAAIPKPSTIADSLLTYALSSDQWFKYYNFDAIVAPPELLLSDPFLCYLHCVEPFHAGVLRIPPNTCYNWHVDTDRGCAVNMLLSAFDTSHCLFAPEPAEVVFPVVELKYRPNTYYVFDTQTPHTVVNGDGYRYLFSVEFFARKGQLSYAQLLHALHIR